MKWNSELYDDAQGYVAEYGKALTAFIPKEDGLNILDLGCGTGDLTNEIDKHFNATVIGSDYSDEMISKARVKYPHLKFSVCDACQIPFSDTFDVIFSNAVFHWIPDQDALHQSIYKALKKGGMLVCEFGGYRNIDKISKAFAKVVLTYGDTYTSPFYFPKMEAHLQILERNGYTVDKIYDYDRPTKLPNGYLGLRQWVCQFFSAELNHYNKEKQEEILQAMENMLEEEMFDGESWIADYRRLRVIAYKRD